MQTQINLSWLEEHKACGRGVYWFQENIQGSISARDLLERLISSGEKEKIGWANWLIARLLSREDCIRYAIYAAELVIHIYEGEFPEDNRPRTAIQAAKAYLDNPSEENRSLARAAAEAADAAGAAAEAADAAGAAAEAAEAAKAAARAADAAWVAWAAAWAAWAAAEATTAAAKAVGEYNLTLTQIVNYGISLLEERK